LTFKADPAWCNPRARAPGRSTARPRTGAPSHTSSPRANSLRPLSGHCPRAPRRVPGRQLPGATPRPLPPRRTTRRPTLPSEGGLMTGLASATGTASPFPVDSPKRPAHREAPVASGGLGLINFHERQTGHLRVLILRTCTGAADTGARHNNSIRRPCPLPEPREREDCHPRCPAEVIHGGTGEGSPMWE
jgi:hypothetical protein